MRTMASFEYKNALNGRLRSLSLPVSDNRSLPYNSLCGMFKSLGALYCDLKNNGETGERDLPEGVQHVKDLTVKHKSIEKK